MIRRLWFSDLAPLRLPWSDLMTIVTRQLLRRPVFGMAKAHAKGSGPLRSWRITAELVAGTTRRNIFTSRVRARRMATITSRMGIETSRESKKPLRLLTDGGK